MVLLALVAWLAATASGLAQEKVEVTSTGVVVIKRGLLGTVSDEKSDRGGTVLKTVQGTPSQTTLVYMPPASSSQLEDVVRYSVNGLPQPPVSVSVQPAAPTLTSPELYEASFKALFVLFIVAVLVESGLALLFRWRPFLDYFDRRSMNALVSFAFSLLFVWLFRLDIVTSLINTYSVAQSPANWAGFLLTAMIIAGGSAGVNRIFRTLGFRAVSSEEQPAPPPLNNDEAWVAITMLRDRAKGSARVLINEAVVGTISGASPKLGFLRYFVRDKGRFPQTGGHTVKAGEECTIEVEAYDASGQVIQVDVRDASGNVKKKRPGWGPYKISPRAIVDIEVKA
jgi:hypothetical protein